MTLTTLVRQALRMRPDRIVVGEVRGAEVRSLLAALNTGHEGGCGTVHANAPADVVARFEALGALAGLSPDAVRAQAAAAIDVVVHVTRDRGGRRVASVAALFRRDGDPCIVPALEWDGPGHEPRPGPAWPALAGRLGLEAQARLHGHGHGHGHGPDRDPDPGPDGDPEVHRDLDPGPDGDPDAIPRLLSCRRPRPRP